MYCAQQIFGFDEDLARWTEFWRCFDFRPYEDWRAEAYARAAQRPCSESPDAGQLPGRWGWVGFMSIGPSATCVAR